MSDRDALAALLYEHQLTGRACMGCTGCPGAEFMNALEHAEHVAALVRELFVVVGHDELGPTEYGWRRRPGWSVVTTATGWAARDASRLWDAEAVSRPGLPWVVEPLEVDGD